MNSWAIELSTNWVRNWGETVDDTTEQKHIMFSMFLVMAAGAARKKTPCNVRALRASPCGNLVHGAQRTTNRAKINESTINPCKRNSSTNKTNVLRSHRRDGMPKTMYVMANVDAPKTRWHVGFLNKIPISRKLAVVAHPLRRRLREMSQRGRNGTRATFQLKRPAESTNLGDPNFDLLGKNVCHDHG